MSDLSPKSFEAAAALVTGWRRPLLVTHEKPDGDAIGALAATYRFLGARGACPDPLLFEPTPERYALLRSQVPFAVLGRDRTLNSLDRCDGVMILDTCAYTQLRPIAEWLRSATQPKLVIDHHLTRDDLANCYLIDESAAATCLILYDWARAVGWPIEVETAQALFVGLATDTGWFHHSNTDARSFIAAADLIGGGVRPHMLYEELYQRDSAARVRLLGVSLGCLKLLCDGALAVMSLDPRSFQSAGASPADTEDIINEPLRIATVCVSVLLVDSGEGVIRVSLRSRATGTPTEVDVAAVAKSLGGGGHRHAAGAKVPGTLEQVEASVLRALQPLL